MGKKKKFYVELQVAYVDVTEDELPAFRAGLALILDLLREERERLAQEASLEKANEDADGNRENQNDENG